ncbi:MAG: hypothetical protein VW268_11895 [Rhodospirillaceae bacterium]
MFDEQQQASTQQISSNVHQASNGTQQVSSNIRDVTQSTSETGAGAQQFRVTADNLSSDAGALKREVETFLSKIRSA